MTKWLWLSAFGALGTVARAEISAWVQRTAGQGFPWGTVAVNLLGSFLFGLVWSASDGMPRAADVRLSALTGFMGAFTTFSTLVFDVEQLGETSRLAAAAGNLALQNVGGIACMIAGLAAGRVFSS